MIENLDQFNTLMEESKAKAIIIDFTATWCGPCKMIGPIFEKLAGEYAGVTFVKVDVDDAEDVAAQCGISAMPTFQVYRDGKKVEEMMGADPKKLEAIVKKYA